MNVALYLTLFLLAGQPRTRSAGIRGANYHWCDQPTHNLRWLNRMIQNARSWPPHHYGWDVYQARYRGQEVFVLSLCRYCGPQRGLLLYNHHGALVGQDEGADSPLLTRLTKVRLLATNAGRFTAGR